MMAEKRSTRIECPDGNGIAVDAYLPGEASAPLPVAVVCHGFKGFKDWGFFPPLAERLAASGRAIVVFDFSHNGVGDVPGEFGRLDLFREQTVSRHVEDLGRVLDLLEADGFAAECGLQRNRHANVVGHSLGAAVAVLRAADDARIVQLCTLNGTAVLDRFGPEALDELERTGQVLVPNARTGRDMPLGRAWFEDAAGQDIEEAATQVFVPALILSGDADGSVPPDESRRFNEWIAGSRHVNVPGADHVFGARHPFAGWTTQLETVFAELDEFLPSIDRLGGI